MRKLIIEALRDFFERGNAFFASPISAEKILDFLDSETIDDFYRKGVVLVEEIGREHLKEELIGQLLVKDLMSFEKQVRPILPSHRDHFVHSIFVYLTGLYIYAEIGSIRKWFKNRYKAEEIVWKIRPESYYSDELVNHNFLFRWRMVALFHDLAYPLEISAKLMNEYSNNSITSYGKPEYVGEKAFFGFRINDIENFYYLGHLASLEMPPHGTIGGDQFNWIDCIRLIAYKMSEDGNFTWPRADKHIDYLTERIKNYFVSSLNKGLIDHGLFSAVIFLKWCMKLYREHQYEPSDAWKAKYFYTAIADSAKVIALHTMHRRLFSPIVPICLREAPLTYLLILCDELQEWFRISGEQDFSCGTVFENHINSFEIDTGAEGIKVKIGDADKTDSIIKKLECLIIPCVVEKIEI